MTVRQFCACLFILKKPSCSLFKRNMSDQLYVSRERVHDRENKQNFIESYMYRYV